MRTLIGAVESERYEREDSQWRHWAMDIEQGTPIHEWRSERQMSPTEWHRIYNSV